MVVNVLWLGVLFASFEYSQPCCMPKQLQGTQEIMQFTQRDESEGDSIITYLTTYTFYGDQCSKLEIPRIYASTFEICVPPFARKTSECSSVNTAHNKTSCIYQMSVQGITQDYYVDENCVIYEQSASGILNGYQIESFLTLTNVTLGIQDTSVFNLPSICDNATTLNVNITQYAELANQFGRRSLPFIQLE